ncbi:MAG: hypothetical protein A2142_09340 [candidate division Zixibacteria bacterium RBG_16_48_11]|nr:MAG: hypothetical protein A2142_09340 [candidate division Zixibacteria bacterium RBG_16_48_11]
MPGFLNPLILFGLVAAAIPFLIHLFTRRRLKKVEFSSLQFLKSLEKTRIRQVKLKNILLLLLRTLIVILIVLAFARPALKGELAGLGKAAATSAVLLLDDSYSMGTQTSQGSLFEIAQKKGAEILNSLSSQDEAAAIYLSGPPDSAEFSRDFWGLKDTLLNKKASYGLSKFSPGLESAKKLLQTSSNLNRELYLLTNKPGRGWEALNSLKDKITLYWFDLSDESAENLSVSELDFGQQLIELGRPFTLKTEVNNHSSGAISEHLVGLYMDDRKVAQTDLKVPSNSKTSLQFTHTLDQPGFHSGYLESAEDDLLADNYRYFVFKIPDRIDVLIVGKSQMDSRLLQIALRPEEKLNVNLQVKAVGQPALEQEDFGHYDVVILNDLPALSVSALANLGRFLETGRGVWIIMGKNADPAFYSEKVARRFFGLELKATKPAQPEKSGFYSLEQWNLRHPIFSIYQGTEARELPELKFYQIQSGQISGPAKVLAYFSGGNPALIEEKVEKGKGLLFLSGLDLASSDISQHPFFVPFVNRLVNYLAQDVGEYNQSYNVGEVVQRGLTEVPANQTIELIYPNNAKETLTPIFTRTSALIKVENTALPGIYQIKAGEKLLDAFAVNLETKESAPEKIDLDKIRKQFQPNQNLKLVEVPANADVAKFIQRTRYGRELWREALILVLVLLGAEMWLGRSSSKPVEPSPS